VKREARNRRKKPDNTAPCKGATIDLFSPCRAGYGGAAIRRFRFAAPAVIHIIAAPQLQNAIFQSALKETAARWRSQPTPAMFAAQPPLTLPSALSSISLRSEQPFSLSAFSPFLSA